VLVLGPFLGWTMTPSNATLPGGALRHPLRREAIMARLNVKSVRNIGSLERGSCWGAGWGRSLLNRSER
jgi:hypothetical protein